MTKFSQASLARFFAAILFALLTANTFSTVTNASGLDVQLKDLRGAYFHLEDAKPAAKSTCAKLTYTEIKKYGRLTHCKPQDDFVECHAKDDETLLVFEVLDACNRSLNKANAKEQ